MSVWSQDPNFVFINAGADIQPASQTDKAVQALYDTYGSKNVLAVKAYGNVDAAPDSSARLVPNGMVVVHPAEAIIQPDSISDSMFQHLMVFPVSRGIKGEVPLKDADFVNEEARARLNEAVPQFSSRPPSMSLRSRMNNGDTENW
jgi:hypothetical protein